MSKKRTRANKIVRVCLLIMGISLLVGVSALMVTGDLNGKVTYEKSEEIVLDPAIEVIQIHTVMTDIRIKETTEDHLQVHYYGVAVGNEGGTIAIEQGDTTIGITLEEEVDLSFSFKNKSYYLDIYVPEDYTNKLIVGTDLCDIQVGQLAVEALEVKSNEGDIHIAHSNHGTLHILGGSGDTFVKVPKGSGFELEFETQSGEFVTTLPIDKEIYYEKSRFRTIHGEADRRISYSGESGTLKLDGL